jgi:hypothetical protein
MAKSVTLHTVKCNILGQLTCGSAVQIQLATLQHAAATAGQQQGAVLHTGLGARQPHDARC